MRFRLGTSASDNVPRPFLLTLASVLLGVTALADALLTNVSSWVVALILGLMGFQAGVGGIMANRRYLGPLRIALALFFLFATFVAFMWRAGSVFDTSLRITSGVAQTVTAAALLGVAVHAWRRPREGPTLIDKVIEGAL